MCCSSMLWSCYLLMHILLVCDNPLVVFRTVPSWPPAKLTAYANVVKSVSPVFYFTSVELGGWEFTPPMISLFFAGVGVSQAIWLLFVFPPLQKKFGTVAVLKGCMIGWPILLLITPACNWLLRNDFRIAFVSQT